MRVVYFHQWVVLFEYLSSPLTAFVELLLYPLTAFVEHLLYLCFAVYSMWLQESNVMLRPPRNLKTDRLMSLSLIVYCDFFAGTLNIIACFVGYILEFNFFGLSLTYLFMTQAYFVPGADAFLSHGHTFTADQQVNYFSFCGYASLAPSSVIGV